MDATSLFQTSDVELKHLAVKIGDNFQQIDNIKDDMCHLSVTTKCHNMGCSCQFLPVFLPQRSKRTARLPVDCLSWGPSFISGGLFGKSAGKFRTALKMPPSYLRSSVSELHRKCRTVAAYLSVSFIIFHDLSISFF